MDLLFCIDHNVLSCIINLMDDYLSLISFFQTGKRPKSFMSASVRLVEINLFFDVYPHKAGFWFMQIFCLQGDVFGIQLILASGLILSEEEVKLVLMSENQRDRLCIAIQHK